MATGRKIRAGGLGGALVLRSFGSSRAGRERSSARGGCPPVVFRKLARRDFFRARRGRIIGAHRVRSTSWPAHRKSVAPTRQLTTGRSNRSPNDAGFAADFSRAPRGRKAQRGRVEAFRRSAPFELGCRQRARRIRASCRSFRAARSVLQPRKLTHAAGEHPRPASTTEGSGGGRASEQRALLPRRIALPSRWAGERRALRATFHGDRLADEGGSSPKRTRGDRSGPAGPGRARKRARPPAHAHTTQRKISTPKKG